jgi:hypothetical protein
MERQREEQRRREEEEAFLQKEEEEREARERAIEEVRAWADLNAERPASATLILFSFHTTLFILHLQELKAKVQKAKRDAERKIRLIRKMEQAVGSGTIGKSSPASPSKG